MAKKIYDKVLKREELVQEAVNPADMVEVPLGDFEPDINMEELEEGDE